MAHVAPILLLLGGVIAADTIWARWRDRRARRLAIKHGRTLTAKFALRPR